jgi:hypothetical protein
VQDFQIPVIQFFVQSLRRQIPHADFKNRGPDSFPCEDSVQGIHERRANPATPSIRNNVQCKHVRVRRILDARHGKSKNPTEFLDHPCYAFGVIYLKQKLRAGKSDVVRETNPVDCA